MQGAFRVAAAVSVSLIVMAEPRQAAADDTASIWKPSPGIPSGLYFGASIDALHGSRTNGNGHEVIPTAGAGSLIDADDLKYGSEGGYDLRARIGYAQWSIEGRYLGGFNWRSGLPDLGAVGNVRIGSFSNFGATALSASADSAFKSFEGNLRWQALPWLTPFVGIRQIKLGDENGFDIAFPAFTAAYRFMTHQRATGVQAGIEARLLGPGTSWQPGPFYADLDARVGWYQFKTDTDFTLRPSTGGLFTGGASDSSHGTIVELGATLGYQITPFWDIHAGYRYISVSDAITASDYAAAATAASSQNVMPNARPLDLQLVTIGTKVMFQPPGTASAASSYAAAPPAPVATIPTGFHVGGSIDALYTTRTNASGPIAIPTAGPGSVIDAEDLAYGKDGGYDIRARAGYAQWAIEGRYLGGFGWKSDVPNLGAVGNVRIGSFSNFGATALSADAKSRFDSWEANLRWQALPWLTPFIGIRQIKIADEDTLTITFPAFFADYHFRAPQTARGVQIGAEVRLVGPGTTWQPGPFYVDVDGRIGLYHLDRKTDFVLLPSTGGSFTGGANGSKNNSPIAEAGATLGYQLTKNWDIHAGYRLIWVRDAITAGDYAAAATAASSQAVVPGARPLELHMVTVGTKVMFP